MEKFKKNEFGKNESCKNESCKNESCKNESCKNEFMKKQFVGLKRSRATSFIIATVFVVFYSLLSSCKFTVTQFIVPDSAGTGEVINMRLNLAATEHSDGATEQGIVLQIPDNWQIISSTIAGYALSEKTQYEQLYTPEQGYKVWVGTISGAYAQDSASVIIGLLTGDFSGSIGDTKLYNIKVSTGAFRNGNWISDDPEGVFEFVNIVDETHFKTITITKEEDNEPPAAVDSLKSTPNTSSCDSATYLNWFNYDEAGQKDIVKYNIYQSSVYTNSVDEMVLINTVNRGIYHYTVNNLTPGENYYFAVTALDETAFGAIPNENKTVEPVLFSVPYSAIVTGKVTDEKSGEPLQFISVVLIQNNEEPSLENNTLASGLSFNNGYPIISGQTDANGVFSLQSVCGGSYQIQAEGGGYRTQTKSIDVDTAHNVGAEQPSYTINFSLLPESGNIEQSYLVLTNSDTHVLKSGTKTNVYGYSGINRITLEIGAVANLLNFPGKNEITIQSDPKLFIFNVSRSGATVTFQDSYGTILRVPATQTAQSIIFNNITLKLVIDNNQVLLGDQIITSTQAPLADMN